jgi:hypothetical protein
MRPVTVFTQNATQKTGINRSSGASGIAGAYPRMRRSIPAQMPTTIPIPIVWSKRMLGKAKTELDSTTQRENPAFSIALRISII